MTRKLTTLFAAILGGLVTITTVFAEENTPSSTSPRPAHGTGMMGDHSGMMSMMRQMSPDQMQQMTRMVDNCNHMMESMTNTPAAPDQETTPNYHD
jgi:Spy/CpxP family protein refolding chaperone